MRNGIEETYQAANWGKTIALGPQALGVLRCRLDAPARPLAVRLVSSALAVVTISISSGAESRTESFNVNGTCVRTFIGDGVELLASEGAPGSGGSLSAQVSWAASLPGEPAPGASQSLSASWPALGSATIPAIWRRHMLFRVSGGQPVQITLGSVVVKVLAVGDTWQLDDWAGPVTLNDAGGLGSVCEVLSWGV